MNEKKAMDAFYTVCSKKGAGESLLLGGGGLGLGGASGTGLGLGGGSSASGLGGRGLLVLLLLYVCVCVRERGFDQLFDDHKTGSVTDEDETYLGRSSGGGNVLLGVLLGSLL